MHSSVQARSIAKTREFYLKQFVSISGLRKYLNPADTRCYRTLLLCSLIRSTDYGTGPFRSALAGLSKK
jgi:hypothetical protein